MHQKIVIYNKIKITVEQLIVGSLKCLAVTRLQNCQQIAWKMAAPQSVLLNVHFFVQKLCASMLSSSEFAAPRSSFHNSGKTMRVKCHQCHQFISTYNITILSNENTIKQPM